MYVCISYPNYNLLKVYMISPLVIGSNKQIRKIILKLKIDEDKEIQTTSLINCA